MDDFPAEVLGRIVLFNRKPNKREKRGVYRILVGRPEGKSPLGRPRTKWEDNTGRSYISCAKLRCNNTRSRKQYYDICHKMQ